MKKTLLLVLFATFLLSIQIVLATDLKVSTDKTEYLVGDTVSISSSLTPAENETISNASIIIRIEQDGSLIKEITSSETTASYSWVADRAGSITIKASAVWADQSASAQTLVSVKNKILNVVLTGVNDRYYPAESFEARITVTDQNGKVVTDAAISSSLLYAGQTKKSVGFSYSVLCDCYKGWVWVEEGYQGTYTLNISAAKTGYASASVTKSFEVVKPSISLSVSSDKSSYYPEEKIAIIIIAKDKDGNLIAPYLSGDIRDEKGFLIENLYPWKDGDVYKEDHYVYLSEVGKKLNITVKGEYKEQKDIKSIIVEVTQVGLMAEVFLDKTTLTTDDSLTGKIEVKDKNGNTISDAWVDAALYDSNNLQILYFSTTYKDGHYVLDKKKINEWQMTGDYKLKIKVTKAGDKKEVEKAIRIERNKLGVNIELDKLSYKPGDRIYLKILMTDPQGNVVQNGWVSGEIFPLSTETRQIEGWPELSKICRMYLSPEGPIYYQGQFLQKYFVDEIYLNDQCPLGKYVLRLKAGKSGYDDISIEKEFEVLLSKLSMEVGTNLISEINSAQINIYAELKDDSGKIPKNINIQGYLHPTDGLGCIKEIKMWFDDKANRYVTNININKNEMTPAYYKEEGACPEGKYTLELTASHRAYSTVNITQIIEVKYKEGYQYRELTPIVTPEPVCKVVSCGAECFQKTCEQENQCPVTVDKNCVIKCKALEKEKPQEMESCLKSCQKRECKPAGSSEQEMMKKLEDIQKTVQETKQEATQTNAGVKIIENMIRSIWNFLRTIFGLPALSETGTLVASNETLPIAEIPQPATETIANTAPSA